MTRKRDRPEEGIDGEEMEAREVAVVAASAALDCLPV